MIGSIALALIELSRPHDRVAGETRVAPASSAAAPVVAVPTESHPSAPASASVGRIIDDVA